MVALCGLALVAVGTTGGQGGVGVTAFACSTACGRGFMVSACRRHFRAPVLVVMAADAVGGRNDVGVTGCAIRSLLGSDAVVLLPHAVAVAGGAGDIGVHLRVAGNAVEFGVGRERLMVWSPDAALVAAQTVTELLYPGMTLHAIACQCFGCIVVCVLLRHEAVAARAVPFSRNAAVALPAFPCEVEVGLMMIVGGMALRAAL